LAPARAASSLAAAEWLATKLRFQRVYFLHGTGLALAAFPEERRSTGLRSIAAWRGSSAAFSPRFIFH